jgi:VWFA-related protein
MRGQGGTPAARARAVACLVLGAAVAMRGAQEPTQQPSFRSGVDVIQLDVSVLDKARHPVPGLTAADFTVLENGKPQRLVSVASVNASDRDPVRSAWMRYASRDVATNDLADELGDGRLFAIVLDDMNLPADDPDILLSARATARYVLDQLGPSDRAAVVFAQDAGKTQDFTDDHTKLQDAIDRLQPRPLTSVELTPLGPGPGGADMAQRFSPLLMRSPCARGEPVLPALDAVTGRLKVLPGQRKTIFYIGVGAALNAGGGRGACDGQLNEMMRSILRTAHQANINVHAIDPAGPGGYREYLARQAAAREQEMAISGRRLPPSNLRALHDFLKSLADGTGGRAVTDTDAIEPSIDRIFEEDGSYYLLGYESSAGAPDGKFRKVEVQVKRPDISVRTRSGYWAPEPSSATVRRDDSVSAADLSMSGLAGPEGVSLRAVAVPLAASGSAGPLVEVGLVVSVKWPALRAATADTLTITRNIYDADGRPGPPVQEIVRLDLRPAGGDETRVDLHRRVALAPGRYQVRFNVTSALLRKTGSVYADLEVPDVTRSPLSLSGLVVGSPVEPGADDAWHGLAPIAPTTARDFAPGQPLGAYLRVFQGGTGATADVSIGTEIYDAHDTNRFSTTTTLEASAFGGGRSAAYQIPLPFDRLTAGPYLLSVTASLPGGRKVREDLLFRIR